ncbi:hypothetical protein HDU97_000784 [Phlyctochytrium planicorne]|nr:hypothetical protein HDU97_000784 [Phlyctochytrium planicorne]
MKLLSILAIVAASVASSTAQNCTGPKSGNICLSNCNGKGMFVKAPQLINEIALGPTFTLDFNDKGEATASSSGVKVGLQIPDALQTVALEFSKAGANIGVGLPGGPSVGRLNMAMMQDAVGTTDKNLLSGGQPKVTLDMNQVPFAAIDGPGFQQLFRTITLGKGKIDLQLNGYASNKASVHTPGEKTDLTADPTVCLEYVSFTAPSSLQGLEGLTDATITELPKIVGGNPETGLELSIKLKVMNPSNIILNLNADVGFDLTFEGQKVGSVILPNMKLAIGENNYVAKSFIHPDKTNIPALLATKKLMSQFTGGQASQVVVKNGKAAKAPVLDAALAAVTIPQELLANQEKLISVAGADISSLQYGSNADQFFFMNANIGAYNPFDTPVQITHIKSTLAYQGKDCLTSDVDVPGFVIPAKGTVASPAFGVKLDGRVDPLLCGSELVTGTLAKKDIRVDVKSTLTLNIGGYFSQIDYNQGNVAVNPVSTPCAGLQDKSYCISTCQNDGDKLPMPIPLIRDIDMPNFSLEFDPANPNSPKATASGVAVKLDVPGWLSFIDMKFLNVGSNIAVGIPGKPTVAVVSTPDSDPALPGSSISSKQVNVDIAGKELKFTDFAGLQEFLKYMTLTDGPVGIHLKGSANNKVQFPGKFSDIACLRYIPFDVQSTSLKGLGGLKQARITKIPTIVAGEPSTGVKLNVELEITNPSTVTLITHSDIKMDLVFEGQVVGKVILPNFELKQGKFIVQAVSYVKADLTNRNQALAVKKMFSQFSSGVVSAVTVQNGKADPLPLLDAALGAVTIPQQLPPNDKPLIINAKADGNTLNYLDDSGFLIGMNTTLESYNPFDVPVRIVSVEGYLSYKGSKCITVKNTLAPAFVLGPRSSGTTPPIPVIISTLDPNSPADKPTADPNCDEFVNAQLIGGTSVLSAFTDLTIVVDRYPNIISYVQEKVSVTTVF